MNATSFFAWNHPRSRQSQFHSSSKICFQVVRWIFYGRIVSTQCTPTTHSILLSMLYIGKVGSAKPITNRTRWIFRQQAFDDDDDDDVIRRRTYIHIDDDDTFGWQAAKTMTRESISANCDVSFRNHVKWILRVLWSGAWSFFPEWITNSVPLSSFGCLRFVAQG